MWQRKQTIYLALVTILMVVASVYAISVILQILGGVIAGLGCANIFQYKTRKRQMFFCTLGILMLLAWVGLFCYDHFYVHGGAVRYPLYAILPIVSIILFWMAKKGIKHDEDLVRSLDRLR
ncbi:MAG: DUF4293 domain-containing protein [Prevotella sp.]|nr:DUF4293 domain-containing protein [Prevotella sp.]MBQ9236869.1 DUF4293 domain-containing protein [Prevotella sp.]MBR1840132.1 DUF4293 domain-containing protein [Prevotella sp.]